MKWNSEWGGKVDFLREIEQKTGETPPALLNRPLLNQFEQAYYEIFGRLSGSRVWGFGGPCPIPLSEIKTAFELFEITDADDRDDYLTVIQELDGEYLKLYEEKHNVK